jgi:hypothetical protein
MKDKAMNIKFKHFNKVERIEMRREYCFGVSEGWGGGN